jgi:ABC-2 type transport system ATP-binding protein
MRRGLEKTGSQLRRLRRAPFVTRRTNPLIDGSGEMVEVDRLTKFYGGFAAIEDVSFSAERGQVLGFLGPNGAGKTTTMRILTGYMPASSGTARVAGFDVFEQSREVRKRIGYLPETPPVYREMTPRSYLDFVARIKGVPKRERAAAITAALEASMASNVAEQPIGTLSRGYKQRVAIAQALVHNPEVLILDEPTIGLDPKQIIEIRNLIRGLAEDRTVILCTHILPEVTQLCDKVVIIARGRIVAEEELDGHAAGDDLEAYFLQVTALDAEGVQELDAAGGNGGGQAVGSSDVGPASDDPAIGTPDEEPRR